MLSEGCFALESVRVLDLSHPLNDQTIFWPGGEGFSLCMSTFGSGEDFYAAGHISCAEHGGTHIDAPYHFCQSGQTVDQLSIEQLMGHCRLIDVESKVFDESRIQSIEDYKISQEDVLEFERQYGELCAGDIVIFRTGWAKRCYHLGTKAYLGFDERIDGSYDPATSKLSFPGIGIEAAQYLVDKKVAGVGLDTGM
jgi:kynurenine formamidase